MQPQNPLEAMFQRVAENTQQLAAVTQEMDMHFDSLLGALTPEQLELFHCNMMQRRAYHLTVAEFATKEKGNLEMLKTVKRHLGELAKEANENDRSESFKTGVKDAMAHIENGAFNSKKKLFLCH